MCQQAVGAPVVPWATWPVDRFAWTRGDPRSFRSSPEGERTFCADCGTSLTFLDPTDPLRIDVTTASFDDPEAFPPEEHIWTSSGVGWLVIDDELPRYAASKDR
jgi:hypothetical protein